MTDHLVDALEIAPPALLAAILSFGMPSTLDREITHGDLGS